MYIEIYVTKSLAPPVPLGSSAIAKSSCKRMQVIFVTDVGFWATDLMIALYQPLEAINTRLLLSPTIVVHARGLWKRGTKDVGTSSTTLEVDGGPAIRKCCGQFYSIEGREVKF